MLLWNLFFFFLINTLWALPVHCAYFISFASHTFMHTYYYMVVSCPKFSWGDGQ